MDARKGFGLSESRVQKSNQSALNSVVPHDLVQRTYSRLRETYAKDLCENWAEEAEPPKNVFVSLRIAAFVIESWRCMYGIAPTNEAYEAKSPSKFSGFVDVACGNGVLVYVLLMEGYEGWGFDACRRTSWSAFPSRVQERLMEKAFIPRPFMNVLQKQQFDVDVHLGDFPQDTFIISNHADELTVWTPLMAALACPGSPMPFLAIPCCSHSLSGAKYRYPQPSNFNSKDEKESFQESQQPASGDLRALRALKQKEKTEEGILDSMYGSLTAKIMVVAQEIGYEVQKSLLPIPGPRNMGVIGRYRAAIERGQGLGQSNDSALRRKLGDIVQRECIRDGGLEMAARMWVERAQGLHRQVGGRSH
ncbi:hypothetical protein N7532_002754 [Penicillium argentinense]|uniref:tRNA (uracil-O(2)-)-methyltransferase n=1 Tax=Penicillium argentinense TaxID=1131581 RepID=A0A9W9G0Y1_9EURO|nr:uncharacterized protein N7532_002754 [Penicillium argentinense]KAJ5110109.1 hypothetical protein N7532_002754 [Penicillium argentinense]